MENRQEMVVDSDVKENFETVKTYSCNVEGKRKEVVKKEVEEEVRGSTEGAELPVVRVRLYQVEAGNDV